MLDLAIVIVNFNSKRDLQTCLDSVFASFQGGLKVLAGQADFDPVVAPSH